MESEPHVRLKEVRILRGFKTSTDAAKRFGWVHSTYRSHENGTRPLSRDAAMTYAKAFRVSVGWLLVGENNAVHKLVTNDEIRLARRDLPHLTWLAVKNMSNIERAIEGAQEFYPVSPSDDISLLGFVITIEDESMLNTDPNARSQSFHPGDLITLDPEKPVRPGDFVLAKVFARDETVFRQYRESGFEDDGSKIITLQPLNSAWAPDRIIEGRSGEVLVRLVRTIRDFN